MTNPKAAPFTDGCESNASLMLQPPRTRSRRGQLALVVVSAVVAFAFTGVKKSAASVQWEIQATSQFGAAVSGFFTLSSANQILDWNVVVGPDAKTPGYTFNTGQFSEFQPGIYLFAANSNFQPGPFIEFALPVPTLAGLTGTFPLQAPNSFFLLSGPSDFEQITGTLTGVTVPVPEVIPPPLISLLLIGGTGVLRSRLRRMV